MNRPDEESQVDYLRECQKVPDVSIQDLWLFGKYASELWRRQGERYSFREFAGKGHSHSSITTIVDTLEEASGEELAEKVKSKAKRRTGHLTEAGSVWAAFAHLISALYDVAMTKSLTNRDKAVFMFDMARRARAETDPEGDWKYYSDYR